MAKKVATRDSWKTTPMSPERAELPLDLHLTPNEFEHLKCGSIPKQMEDKWFVFHEDGWVFFHRSWTGYCVYQVRFERIDDEYVVAEGWVTRDSKEYNNNDIEKDVRQLSLLLHYRFGIGSEPCEE